MPQSGVLVGIDIGGTLSKIAVCCTDSEHAQRIKSFIKSSNTYGKTGKRDKALDIDIADKKLESLSIMFVSYETARTKFALEVMRREKLIQGSLIGCTGGGAFKYNNLFKKELNADEPWEKIDEMKALVTGMTFLIQKVPDAAYTFDSDNSTEDKLPRKKYLKVGEADHYPRLIVNVGSGVSILLMTSPSSYKRVGGSSLGGGTFLGLAKQLAKCSSFEEALDLAKAGDSHKVDLLVGDIYGGHYCALGLQEDTIAAYFGKLARCDSKCDVKREDLMAALLKLITYSIGTTAWLYARIYNPKHLIFTGNFLKKNVFSEWRMAFMVRRMSEGKTVPLFMNRAGYFGALGALVSAVPSRSRRSGSSLSLLSIETKDDVLPSSVKPTPAASPR
mmetsp:Transcript_21122/g.29601  ORF Transcript_21122/g.29601 Transcript_21122/m.29601 type:complete len:390 (+) Transcript_21122:45-1214(+)